MTEMLYSKRGKRYAPEPEPELSALAPFDAVERHRSADGQSEALTGRLERSVMQ